MRTIITSIAIIAALGGNPASAEDTTDRQATRIEIDQITKSFVFVIDNEPVAMLDQAGLHVVGEISYGATLTDTGSEHQRKRIVSLEAEAADD